MIYSIDFNRWIALMLPTFMRRRRIFGLCRALCAPLFLGDGGLYGRFSLKRAEQNYRLGHNGQVCYLRGALNDAFGLRKGFEIADAVESKAVWRYVRKEHSAAQLLVDDEMAGALLIGDESQIRTPHNRFIVHVPEEVAENGLEAVRAVVDKYRLCSKHPIYIVSNNPVIYKNEQSELH